MFSLKPSSIPFPAPTPTKAASDDFLAIFPVSFPAFLAVDEAKSVTIFPVLAAAKRPTKLREMLFKPASMPNISSIKLGPSTVKTAAAIKTTIFIGADISAWPM